MFTVRLLIILVLFMEELSSSSFKIFKMCQLCDYLFLLISYLGSISIYKLLVDTLLPMCLACCVAERVGLFLDTVGMVHLY